MEYSKLDVILKRYSFEDKMTFSYYHSKKSMKLFGMKDIDYFLKNYCPFPWEIETFTLFSIYSKEYDANKMTDKIFGSCINAIRNHQHPTLFNDNKKISDYFLISLAPSQLIAQEDNRLTLFRYYYIFTFINDVIDVKKEFKNKFGIDYDDFLNISGLLQGLLASETDLPMAVINYIFEKYPQEINLLTVTRSKYIDLLKKFSTNTDDFLYCVRPSYTYSFIQDDNNSNMLYFPLPHLFIKNITTSLFYRLTENNNTLRAKIGKEVLENYLYTILSESNAYDEIRTEITYTSHGSESKTPDVICRTDNQIIFFDSKSFAPKIRLRLMDEAALENDILRLAEAIKQLYQQILNLLSSKFSLFNSEIPKLNQNNIWGVIVILEDIHIKQEIYKKAYEMIIENVDEKANFKWLITHIKIESFYEIERFALTGSNIILELKRSEKVEQEQYISLNTHNNVRSSTLLPNTSYQKFKDIYKDKMASAMIDLQS